MVSKIRGRGQRVLEMLVRRLDRVAFKRGAEGSTGVSLAPM